MRVRHILGGVGVAIVAVVLLVVGYVAGRRSSCDELRQADRAWFLSHWYEGLCPEGGLPEYTRGPEGRLLLKEIPQ